MNSKTGTEKKKLKDQIVWKILIPGGGTLILLTALALIFGDTLEPALNTALLWMINNFQWLWVSVTLIMVGILVFLMLSKYGNIVIGGRNAKPIMSTWTWVSMAITGGIAVGICFFGTAGPLSYFLNPPAFLNIQGGTPEAIIPAFTWTYINWAFAPYAYMAMGGLLIAFAYFNVKREFRAGATLYPIIKTKGERVAGLALDIFQVAMLIGICNNYGLAGTQLSAGIDFTFGLSVPIPALIIAYAVISILIVCTKGYKLMGKVSTINMWLYITMLAVVLLAGPTNRLLGTFFESVTQYIMDFIPMTGFSDVGLQTHWLDTETIFYYSWTLGAIFGLGLFFALLGRGRTIRQFVIVNFLVPCVLIFAWFSFFGGTAIYQYMGGDTRVADVLATQGSGYATFAFLETLPGGKFWCIVYIVMAIFTFLTNSTALIYASPKLFLKGDRAKNDAVAPPTIFAIAHGGLSALLCIAMMRIGGMNAVSIGTILYTAPVIIVVYIALAGLLKALFQRKKYDASYIQECIEDGKWTAEDEAAADPGVMLVVHSEE